MCAGSGKIRDYKLDISLHGTSTYITAEGFADWSSVYPICGT